MLAAVVGLVLSGVVCSLAATAPRRCCFDKQYSVQMGVVGEVLNNNDPDHAFFLDGVIRLGFDYYTDRQGIVSDFKLPDGSTARRYELKDYAMRRVYTTMNGTCTYKDIESYDMIRPPCIPDNATYVGPSVLGYGHNSMPVHTWAFNYWLDAVKPSQLVLTVTEDHCVPVTETIIGVINGVILEEALFFVDYHPGIERLERLEPPQNCQPAPTPTTRQ